jgi:pentose-5-phosphate-3-epimerase
MTSKLRPTPETDSARARSVVPSGVIAPSILWADFAQLGNIILVTTTNPGFGEQTLRAICAERDLHPIIEVDSGENITTAGQAAATIATVIVTGSANFDTNDYAEAIAAVRASARRP